MSGRLYLDHNATSPLRPPCRDAMMAALDAPRNPSSVHEEGRAAKRIIETARRKLANRLSCPPASLVFTSGGTEALHLAVLGAARGGPKVRRIFLSAIEHSALEAAAEASGLPVEIVPVRTDGTADLAWLEERLHTYDADRDGPFLLALMMANNETGALQPVAEAALLVRKNGGYLLTDAVQAAFKREIDCSLLGADFLVLSAHKAGGPLGAAALFIAPGVGIAPLFGGGGQEENRRAGTQNAPAIAGLGALAELNTVSDYSRVKALRDRIEDGLPRGTSVYGQDAPRLSNTLCFSAQGFASETQVMTLDLAGIAASAGSACSSGKVKASGVLKAMGASEGEASSALRISLGWDTPGDAPERFLAAYRAAYDRITLKAAS